VIEQEAVASPRPAKLC